jgi:uncharacterized membrane protein HdeD (DUF308 family)
MTATGNTSHVPVGNPSAPPFWVCVLLGIVLILAGFFILGDVVLVTVISAFVIGIAAIVAGAFEIVHAFWTKGWGGFIWQILLGALYVALGVMLVRQPIAGALVLTYVLGLVFLVSGAVRAIVGVGHWRESGWIMVASGVFGILAGLVVLSGFPMTGLWVLGFLLGIDLIIHGVAWLTYAWLPAAKTA